MEDEYELLLIDEMVIIRDSSSCLQSRNVWSDAAEFTEWCFNSYDVQCQKIVDLYQLSGRIWNKRVNPRLRSDFVPNTNTVYGNQVLVRAVASTADGRHVSLEL